MDVTGEEDLFDEDDVLPTDRHPIEGAPQIMASAEVLYNCVQYI